ncbi:MAG: TolC family protein [Acidobacteria bacterium]|nr:TolC family protein [Acidobacteriota bacterium]
MSKKLAMPIGVAFAMALTGWPVYGAGPAGSGLHSVGEKPSSAYPASLSSTMNLATTIPEPTGDLTLREVLPLALKANPELAPFSREIRAREAAVLQARLFPNPDLSVTAANLGNAVLKDFDGPQTTVSLSQLILLGGKRGRGIEVAGLDRDLAAWDYETKRMNVLTRVAQAFVEVLRAQKGLVLANDLMALAQRVVDAASARVRAGQVSPVEETRARVTLASVKIEQARAARELNAARKRLAATWGSTTPRFKTAQGKLDQVLPIPTLEGLIQRLTQNPDLARWATELAQRQATVDLEQSRAIPDLTVSLGVTQFTDSNDSALVAGVSIPLPILNRNQGNIQQAHQRLTKAMEERRAAGVLVTTALNTAYESLTAAHAEVTTLRQEVLPGAQSAFEAASRGYRLGKFGFLDVLDAQRTLFGAKAQYLRALASYHQAVAEVERLIGEPVDAARSLEE